MVEVWGGGVMDLLGLIYVKELKFRTKSSFCERWQRIRLPRPGLGLAPGPAAVPFCWNSNAACVENELGVIP